MIRVYQILPPHHWAGCLIYVEPDGIRIWGVKGYMVFPGGTVTGVVTVGNRAYIRVNTAEIKLIGETDELQ